MLKFTIKEWHFIFYNLRFKQLFLCFVKLFFKKCFYKVAERLFHTISSADKIQSSILLVLLHRGVTGQEMKVCNEIMGQPFSLARLSEDHRVKFSTWKDFPLNIWPWHYCIFIPPCHPHTQTHTHQVKGVTCSKQCQIFKDSYLCFHKSRESFFSGISVQDRREWLTAPYAVTTL